MSTVLRCPACATAFPRNHPRFRCDCGEPLDVEHAFGPVSRELFDARIGRAEPPFDSGVWRFKELVDPDLDPATVVSRPEGNTPLYHAPAVAKYVGLDAIRLKHEGMNPTGSFKDRGMTVAVTQGVASGAQAVVCASTGNTSASVAAYAAICGIPAVILVPESATAAGKLGQALAYGARTVMVRGNFDDAMSMVQEASADLGLYLLNSLNPFRIQGQKAIILEILQQLQWEPPDWIAFPAGNLGNCSAFGRALSEAHQVGLIDRLPRLLAVQASGASPFSAAFRTDFGALNPVSPETVATAIRIGHPVSYHRAIQSIRATDGLVIDVDDDAILDAKAVVDAAGIGAEPASCAPVAGVRRLVADGTIGAGERVVTILTGHLLKDPDTTLRYHQGKYGGARANPPITIDATVEALARVVRAARPTA